MKKVLSLILIVFVIILVNNENVLAQNLPVITYPTPQSYPVGSPIAPLLPINTGAAVFPANYTTPVVFAPFITPFSIAIDGQDNVYTTNNSTGDLTKFDSGGIIIFTVNTGNALASEVAVDGLGNIYVSQFTANSVLKYSPNGTLLATIPGFSDPYGITFDAANNAYVTNRLTGGVLKIAVGTTIVSAYLTGFNTPYGIITDVAGNMYVSEQGPGDIIKVAAGTLTRTTFASGLNGPRHLNKDAFGNVYVADYGNNAIKRISPAGKITTILSTGLSSPRQAAFDSSGNLFIANYGQNTLLKSVATSYSINAALPAGLNFNTSTGQITGTPSAPSAAITFNITAYNTGGTGTTPLTITVGQQSETVTTFAPAAITATTATLNGLVSNNGSSALVSFTYGTDPNLINGTTIAATTNGSLNIGNSNNSTLILAGLQSLTTYYYRITATDSSGTTPGNTISFATSSSSNAALSNLSVSSGNLNPAFASGTGNYTLKVANNINSITLTPVASDSTATVTVNSTTVASGTASGGQALNVGNNTITTTVTAQDGISTQSYTLTVTRAASSNAALSNLTVSSGILSPAFTSGTGNYTLSVANNINSITVTPVTSDSTATVTINGTTVASGTASAGQALNVGNNTITTTVTAQDGISTQSYTLTVTRAASSNAALSNLSISSGNISPAFASSIGNYTVSIANNIRNIAVTPVASDSTAFVTINGTRVAPGTGWTSQALNVGDNTVITTVTAQDGTSQSYTLVVTRASSSNADLAALNTDTGTMAPVFSATVLNYNLAVNNSTSTMAFAPVASDPNATLTVNGIALAGGTSAVLIPLAVGDNTITTTVTASNGTTAQSYTVIVYRQKPALAIPLPIGPSSNANLANLTLSSGSLGPAFVAATMSYTTSVSNATASISITPTTFDNTATLTVNGIKLSSGTSSLPIALGVGNNTITTVVTAQDGITKNIYTVIVNRAKSSNADLAGLAVGSGTLNPGFVSAIKNYVDSVDNSISSIQIRPTTSDKTATLTVNGIQLLSGAISAPIALTAGNNSIAIVVTAQDGITTEAYTLTVFRAPSSNANLSNLTLSSGSLTPLFATGTVSYTASVSSTIASITITPKSSDVNATLTVNGAKVAFGTTSWTIPLATGNNTITTVVTAQDGKTQKIYTVIVTRAPSSDATLSNLVLSDGSLTPLFASGTTGYKVSVSNVTDSVTVKPVTSNAAATVTVNGTNLATGATSAPIALQVGINTITTVVTAQDGRTRSIYTVSVTRSAIQSNANLASLTLSSGTLSPAFSTSTTYYSASVSQATSSIQVTATTSDAKATLKLNGKKVASGSASRPIALKVGANTISLVVTSSDGMTTTSYTLNVTRQAMLTIASLSNASLSNLTVSGGSLSPAFSTGTNSYQDTVGYGTTSIALTPIVNDSTATVTVNGTLVVFGSPSANLLLVVGNNPIITVVTAQDGKTTDTYTVNVVRSPNILKSTLLSSTSHMQLGISGQSNTTFAVTGANTINRPKSVVSANESVQDAGIKDENRDKILVHQAVSPNGDGINDFLLIEGIEKYPGNKVAIINRDGAAIYNVSGYNNSDKVFDGHSNINGRLQQPGTYFYMIEYTVDGQLRRKTGYFILKF